MSQNDCLWAWSEHQHVTRPNPQLMMIFSFFFSFLSFFCVLLLLSTPSDVTSPLPLTIRFWLHFFFFHLLYTVRLNVLIFFSCFILLLLTAESLLLESWHCRKIFLEMWIELEFNFYLKVNSLHPHYETKDLLSKMTNWSLETEN